MMILLSKACRSAVGVLTIGLACLAAPPPVCSEPPLTPQEQTILDLIVNEVLGGQTEGVRIVVTPPLPAEG